MQTKRQKGVALVTVGLLGWATGTWLPPELVAELLGSLGL